MRARFLLPYAFCLLCVLYGTGVFGQDRSESDAEKRRQFLKAREEMRAIPPTKPATSTAVPKPKPRTRTTPTRETRTPSPTPRRRAPEPTPRSQQRETPEPSPQRRTTSPEPQPSARPERQPSPRPATPRATPRPVTPRPRPAVTPPPAPVVIEKSGVDDDERGLQPAAPAGWFTRWKYLSRAVRKEIDRAPVQKRRWRYIVIHNSGTRQGNAKAFDYYHRRVRKMPNGMAYHFVIGNGTSSGDGEIEIGERWRRQINGGHVHSDYLNNIALGICLVGDFNRDAVTRRQLAATEELVRYLRRRVGKIDRKWAIVKPHRAINPPRWPTDCPGDRFPYRWLDAKFN